MKTLRILLALVLFAHAEQTKLISDTGSQKSPTLIRFGQYVTYNDVLNTYTFDPKFSIGPMNIGLTFTSGRGKMGQGEGDSRMYRENTDLSVYSLLGYTPYTLFTDFIESQVEAKNFSIFEFRLAMTERHIGFLYRRNLYHNVSNSVHNSQDLYRSADFLSVSNPSFQIEDNMLAIRTGGGSKGLDAEAYAGFSKIEFKDYTASALYSENREHKTKILLEDAGHTFHLFSFGFSGSIPVKRYGGAPIEIGFEHGFDISGGDNAKSDQQYFNRYSFTFGGPMFAPANPRTKKVHFVTGASFKLTADKYNFRLNTKYTDTYVTPSSSGGNYSYLLNLWIVIP